MKADKQTAKRSVSLKNKTVTCVMTFFFLGLSLLTWSKRADSESESERRRLAQFPEISMENILSGEFMKAFEEYTMDQFPFRDELRTLKAVWTFSVFGQKDNAGMYVADGHVGKLEYPLQEKAVDRATDRFRYIYDTYMSDTDVKLYCSVIPDKNYFLAEQNGYLSMDYDAFYELVKEKTDYMEYIDIAHLLTVEDYYKTDIHWRQEKLIGVAEKIASGMGVTLTGEYEIKTLDKPFYGVYYGQAALPLEAEEIKYLSNEMLEQCVVYDFQNEKNVKVYDMDKAYGRDPYEMFLSGGLSLIEIKNPKASTDKELVMFRDSFGSSLAPLLVEGYATITLVDIRYIHPDMLDRYIEFENQDVLFLYSVPVLNHGEAIK